jgi:ATP-binding cassette subfamily B protein
VRPVGQWRRSWRAARRFGPQIAAYRGRLVAIALLSLAVIGLDLARPWPIQWLFDEGIVPVASLGGSEFARVVAESVAALLAIALAGALAQYFRAVSLSLVSSQLTRAIRARLFEHLGRLAPTDHAEHKSGDLVVRVLGDAPAASAMIVESSFDLATRALLALGTVVALLLIDWKLALVLAAVLPPLALVVQFFAHRVTAAVEKQRGREGDLADFTQEALAGHGLIQALGRADWVAERFGSGNKKIARADFKASRLSARLAATVETLLALALAGALALGAWRVHEGALRAGELLVFLSYVRSLQKPVRASSKQSDRIAKGTACAERILAVLDRPVAVANLPGAVPAPDEPRVLGFEDVAFAYPGEGLVLDGFSAEFRRGELTALVGSSGAGKSTASALALRLVDPARGRVCLDGVDLRRIELESLRRRFAPCPQETLLFGETLRENLLLARAGADDAELWRALERAAADGFVRALPELLDTELSGGGGGLSGGERKRLTIARTFLRDSPIVVLDEPFAGLDRPSLERVARSLAELATQRIVLVIAHDLGHLELFDRIVFLDQGRAADCGTHAELERRSPRYREVVRAGAAARSDALVPLAQLGPRPASPVHPVQRSVLP